MKWFEKFLSVVEDYEDELISLVWVLGVLVGMLTLPPGHRADVLSSWAFTALVAATGFGIAIGRLGRAADGNVLNTQYQNIVGEDTDEECDDKESDKDTKNDEDSTYGPPA